MTNYYVARTDFVPESSRRGVFARFVQGQKYTVEHTSENGLHLAAGMVCAYVTNEELAANFDLVQGEDPPVVPPVPAAPKYLGVFPTVAELRAGAVPASPSSDAVVNIVLRTMRDRAQSLGAGTEISVIDVAYSMSDRLAEMVDLLETCGWYAVHCFDLDEGHWLTIQDTTVADKTPRAPRGEIISGKVLRTTEAFYPRSGSCGGPHLILVPGTSYVVATKYNGGYFIEVSKPRRFAYIRADEMACCTVSEASAEG